MSALPPSGILVVDKPAGWTSHDVVAVMRRALGTRRVGHGGTLDPFATGVLPLLYGAATSFADRLHRAPKAYVGEIVLGAETSTDDPTGQVVADGTVPALDDAAVRAAFARRLGRQRQRPPAVSAIRVGGVRSYARARRGELVELPERDVEIFELTLVERGPDCLHFLVACSAGTYVRALARDLGRDLGTRAHLGALRRIAAGGFFIEEAVPVEEARRLAELGALGPLVHAPDAAVLELAGAVLAREAARRLRQGRPAELPRPPDGHQLRVYDTRGAFVGIGEVEGRLLRPRTIFASGEDDARADQDI